MRWTFPLFRIFGIPVRMHFLMAILIAVYIVRGAAKDGWWGVGWMSVTMAILILSILFHELAHCWAATRLGGDAEQILIWPLGGLATVHYHWTEGSQIKVAGIGPLSSVALSAGCFAALPLSGAGWAWEYLLPFDDWWPRHFSLAQVFVLHAARLNLILALFNLCVPAYPLDGGQVLYGFLSLRYGRVRAAETVTLIAIPVGAAMAILGFAQNQFLLGFIGVWVIIEAFQLRYLIRIGELERHPAFGGHVPEFEYMPDRPRRKGWFARWRERRAQARSLREREDADRERKEVDVILEKVSRQGMGSLTSSERKILDRASRRGRGEEP